MCAKNSQLLAKKRLISALNNPARVESLKTNQYYPGMRPGC